MPPGETLTVSFQVRITDGHAKAPTQTLTFTIVGTNDAATISGHHAGTVYEDGDLYAVDVDAETLAYVQAFGHAPTTASGDLDIADKDRGEAVFRKPAARRPDGQYGEFAFDGTRAPGPTPSTKARRTGLPRARRSPIP